MVKRRPHNGWGYYNRKGLSLESFVCHRQDMRRHLHSEVSILTSAILRRSRNNTKSKPKFRSQPRRDVGPNVAMRAPTSHPCKGTWPLGPRGLFRAQAQAFKSAKAQALEAPRDALKGPSFTMRSLSLHQPFFGRAKTIQRTSRCSNHNLKQMFGPDKP